MSEYDKFKKRADGVRVTHELKIIEPYTSAVRSRVKKFEIRKNDRDFREGDILFLEPYDPYTKKLIQPEHTYDLKCLPIIKRISYITDFEQKDGYVVISLQDLD